MKCAVINCNYKELSNERILSFFSFPKNENLNKQWRLFCGNPNQTQSKHVYICSQHFKAEDIVGGLAFEIGMGGRRRLKPGAIPCIKNVSTPDAGLLNVTNDNPKVTANSRPEDSDTKLEIAVPENVPSERTDALLLTPMEFSAKPYETTLYNHLDIDSSEAVIDELNNQISTLRSQNLLLKVNMQVAQRDHKTEIKKFKKLLEKMIFQRNQLEAHLESLCTNEQFSNIKEGIELAWSDKSKG